MDAKPFATPAALRAWFAKHHASEPDLWILFHKVASGKGGVSYQEALDEALCVGWIDTTVKGIDEGSYARRWTPRKKRSYWSAVNIKKAEALVAAGRMKAPGLAAFEARDKKMATRYSFEGEPPPELPAAILAEVRRNKAAFTFWEKQPPSYRKVASHWLVTAKKDETKARRLALFIAHHAKGERIPQFVSPKGAAGSSRAKR